VIFFKQLNRAYFRIAKLMSEKTEAEELLEDILTSVHAVSNLIGSSDTRRLVELTCIRT